MDGRPNRRKKAAFSNSSGLKRVFEKLQCREDGRPNRRNRAAFSNFSGLKSVFVPD